MTGRIGVDTCFLIDFFKGDKNAVEFFENHGEKLVFNDLIVFEFLCGNLTDKQAAFFKDKITLINKVGLNGLAFELGADIFRAGKKNGKNIGAFNAMISAGYLSNSVKQIVTRNVKHFKDISELTIV